MSKQPRKNKLRIISTVAAQPGYWAIFGETLETVVLSLPIVCWVTIEEENTLQREIRPYVVGSFGALEDAVDDDGFLGMILVTNGQLPPEARHGATPQEYIDLDQLKSKPEEVD